MTSIVIPFIPGPDNSFELRQALRSMQQNLQFDFKPFVFSHEKPDWLRDDCFVFQERKRGMDLKFKDQLYKIHRACIMCHTSENFIYTYDDVYFLNPVSLQELKIPRAKQDLTKVKDWFVNSDAQANWKEVMKRTLLLLQQKGAYIYNYETHLPRFFYKKSCINIFQEFKCLDVAYQFSTLYFNLLEKNPVLLSKYDFFKLGIYKPKSYQHITRLAKRYKILNYSENCYIEDMKKALRDLFPNKCKFEV